MIESQYTKETFLSHETLGQADDAVSEVFVMVFGVEVEAAALSASAASDAAGEERTGVVSFFGAMSGSLELRMDHPAAVFVTSAFLGGAPVEEGEDDSINDAVGELCNMIAGGWKNRNASLTTTCFLTPPTVDFGANLRAPRQNVAAQVHRTYHFGEHSLQITLHCDELSAAA